ncbi:MAG TPA: AgmX/PglI C-terminal domain-containing protein [Polyangia bacterium]
MRRALICLLGIAGCAAAPARAPAGVTAAAAESEPPPVGSKRLPSSINCEPDPPQVCAAGCATATGAAARHVGSLDTEVVRAGIASHVAEVRVCYDAIALINPEAEGILRVRFGIGPSGIVRTSCLMSSELNAPSVDRCVLDRLLTWRFPAPNGGGWVVVSYPFALTRVGRPLGPEHGIVAPSPRSR